ncbi:MAG TPA: choice-of-anchor U domain-containing protein [Candidatus Saccharimonadales bacterium]|nr:choice-of-anchor U domain-containing protein [Candidatus Saccharimonadales bacterium]
MAIQFIYGTSSTLATGNTTVTLDDGTGSNLTASGASLQPFSTSVSALTNGTTYYYKLRACTTSNCSSFVDGSIVNFVAQNPPSNPVLSVSKTEDDADNFVTPDQVVTYTVTITNSGGVSGSTSFTDTIPTGMNTPSNFTYTNCGTPSSSYSAPTLTVSSLSVDTVNNCIVTYSVAVNNPLNEGTTLTNSVDVAAASEGGNNPAPISASTLTVDATPNLSTSTKTVSDLDGGTVLPGDTLRYTITTINTGNGQATGVAITDTIDTDTQNLTNVTRTNCGSSTNSSTSTQLNITGATVQVGTNCVITFDVSVKSPLTVGTALSNTATIGAATEGGVGASPSSTTLFSAAPPSTPNLVVTHSEDDADDTVFLNQTVGYTITIENNGGASGSSITATSTLASDASLNTGSFNYTNCGTPGSTSTTSSLALNSITIAAGQTCTITYTVSVKNSASSGDTIASSVDVGQATEGGNNPAPALATTLSVLILGAPSGLQFSDGATNLGCSGTTANRSMHLSWNSVSGATDYQVSLDGGSANSTSSSLSYDWVMPAVDGVHAFKVRAVDGASNTTAWSSTCQVTLDQTAPTVNAGTDQTTGSAFTQSSSSASDGGSGVASYAWTKVSGPGTLTFNDATILHPQISASSDGTYVVRLTVTDSAGNSASDTFTLVWDTSTPPPGPSDDNDGATPTEEQAAPDSGDANNDGTADADQSNVTSFVNPVTNTYAVLENTSGCQNTDVSQQAVASLAQADGNYQYPAGLMSFKLVCSNPGMTAHINQYFYGVDATQLVARKYDTRTHSYTTIAGAVITNVIIGGQPAVKISYDLTDGGPLDQDGTADGTIIDPSGPAVLAASSSNALTNTGTDLLVIAALSGCTLLATAVVRTRKYSRK